MDTQAFQNATTERAQRLFMKHPETAKNVPSIEQPTEENITRAVACLRAGEAIGLPTETVYGLAADASNADAVTKIFSAKGRPVDHPLIVHVASVDAARAWAADWPEAAEKIGQRVLARPDDVDRQARGACA